MLSDFPDREASLIGKQACSELLDLVANFFELERGETEGHRKVMGMQRPTYLALPWHSVAEEIAGLKFDIVTSKLNKCMKSCHPARPLDPKDFFLGIDYHTHNLEGYVLKPESLIIPSRPPPAEPTAEDQPFFLVHKHPDDPRERVNEDPYMLSIVAKGYRLRFTSPPLLLQAPLEI